MSLRTISDRDLLIKCGHLMERRAETPRGVEENYGKGTAGPELALSEGFGVIIRKLLDGEYVRMDFAASALRSALLANAAPPSAEKAPSSERSPSLEQA